MPVPVSTTGAPGAIGPYSQAVVHRGLAYCSGQIALDPTTGAVVPGGIVEQTEQVLANLDAVLTAAGASRASVLRTTVYLRDMAEFAEMNLAYAAYFGDARPARATVAVAGLPRDVRVEIDCIAAVPDVR